MASSPTVIALQVFVLLSGATASCSSTQPRQEAASTRQLEAGRWGGEGVHLETRGEKSTFRFVCAEGRIDGPITIDGDGKFVLNGKYRSAGGARRDVLPAETEVEYSGIVSGDQMSLTVAFKRSGSPSQRFTLRHGVAETVHPCP